MNTPTQLQLHEAQLASRAPDSYALRKMRENTGKGIWWAAYRHSSGEHILFLAVGEATKYPETPPTFPGFSAYSFYGYIDLDTGLVETPV